MALVDFTLSNARRFYSSMGNPLGLKELNDLMNPRPTEKFHNISCYLYSRKYCVKWQVT